MTVVSDMSSPFVGLMPFEERDAEWFFGRDKDRRSITANLIASRLTVVYGDSGVGKSSLLRAGVLATLQRRDTPLPDADDDDEPLARRLVALAFNDWGPGARTRLLRAVCEALGAESLEPAPAGVSLDSQLARWTDATSAELLIILDQLEEYLTYSSGADDDNLANELATAIRRPDLHVNFIFSIRADSLARLDEFKERLPTVFENRLRVDHLTVSGAREAIEEPLKRFKSPLGGERITAEPDLVAALLDEVRLDTAGARSQDALVATPLLQLVLQRLWKEELEARSPRLTLATLKRLGGAKSIVRRHVDEVMSGLPAAEQQLAAHVFHFLVTPRGTKLGWTIPDLAHVARVDPELLASLLVRLAGEVRVLRTVGEQAGERRYEIYHDVLGAAILGWQARRVSDTHRTASSRDSPRGAGWGCQNAGSYRLLLEDDDAVKGIRKGAVAEVALDGLRRLVRRPPAVEQRRMRARRQWTGPDGLRPLDAYHFGMVIIGDPGQGDAPAYAVTPGILAHGSDSALMLVCGHSLDPSDAKDFERRFAAPYRRWKPSVYAVGPPTDKRVEGVHASPFFALDAPSLRIVCVDPEPSGELPGAAGAWLRQVSAGSDKPKLLVSTRALYRDGRALLSTLSAAVADPAHRYVAAIGGDGHNYQRYAVRQPDGRMIQHVVAGGGGPTAPTHGIPRVVLPGCDEEAFRCYPARGDSLAIYSRHYDRHIPFRGPAQLSPADAAALVSERVGIAPVRAQTTAVSHQARRVAGRVWPLTSGEGGAVATLTRLRGWGDPPFFASFLRVDVAPAKLRLRCFGVTGCLEHEQDPPVEDDVTVPLT